VFSCSPAHTLSLGSRGIWHKGWKAVTDLGPFSGLGNFDKDHWSLFHTDEDRAEAHDLADKFPEKVKELAALWMEEAKRYNVLPLIDYSVEKDIQKIMELEYHIPVTPSGKYTYYRVRSQCGNDRLRTRMACRTR
jgi:hypothetical protein